ncbi:MAG: helix-turn-helix domain-containing protein [Lachnospiraceae bacterium]|nr:helix-turn-helix domain-containing protein [Lachnospiraceae bacterium]
MTLEEMKKRKQELGYSNEQLAMLSGVPLGTLQKLFGGATKHPRYATLQALEKALSGAPYDSSYGSYAGGGGRGYAGVGESSVQYNKKTEKRQGEYTLEDYYALPDDERMELIDGRLYKMEAPSVVHQIVSLEIAAQIHGCIKKHKMPCRVLTAPCDVQLDRDRKTMLQPDIMVICDQTVIKSRAVFGAPDLIMEILSPATRKKDMTVKYTKYVSAGVKEYWLIDPDREEVMVYLMEGEGLRFPSVFKGNAVIPVSVSGGKCSIDFGEIWEELRATDIPQEDTLPG